MDDRQVLFFSCLGFSGHLFHINAYLQGTAFLFRFHSHADVFGDQNTDIGFIDRADVFQFLIFISFAYLFRIAFEICRDIITFPAAFLNQPERGSEVEQGDDRLNPVFPAGMDHVTVVLDLLFIKDTFFRFDPAPFQRESVGI